jgi:hypothetical protein
VYTKEKNCLSKFGDVVVAFTLSFRSQCESLNKQDKFLEATEMRFLMYVASHKRTGHKNKVNGRQST